MEYYLPKPVPIERKSRAKPKLPVYKPPPFALFDQIIKAFNLKNDAALGRMLGLTHAYVSKVRSGRLKAGPEVILKVHDATGWSIKAIKGFL